MSSNWHYLHIHKHLSGTRTENFYNLVSHFLFSFYLEISIISIFQIPFYTHKQRVMGANELRITFYIAKWKLFFFVVVVITPYWYANSRHSSYGSVQLKTKQQFDQLARQNEKIVNHVESYTLPSTYQQTVVRINLFGNNCRCLLSIELVKC